MAILAVTFTGTVRTYDALDRRTWGAAVAGATSIARATAAFSAKNARFFAGYAVDARQVPFAWTPPGRVFVGVDVERTALVDPQGVQEVAAGGAAPPGAHRGRCSAEPRARVLPAATPLDTLRVDQRRGSDVDAHEHASGGVHTNGTCRASTA